MSAELLREAAALMRRRAKAAAQEPSYLSGRWEADESPEGDGIVWASGQFTGDPVLASSYAEVAIHAASWHPAVALAVADWLDAEADEIPPRADSYKDGPISDAPAARVARAYLGTP